MRLKVELLGDELRTTGLEERHLADVTLRLTSPSQEAKAKELLARLAEMQVRDGGLKDGAPISEGYWDVIPQKRSDGVFELFEWNADRTERVRGVTLTLGYLAEQMTICEQVSASFAPPSPKQMIAISSGVMEGTRPIEGVRYHAPPHMSGWYLTTDLYDGNVDSLLMEHAYHVTAKRPELARYLALPPGYRFVVHEDHDDISFDPDVAREGA